MGFRALPLFPAPLNVPGAGFAVTRDEMAAALFRLFVHWFEKGRPISIDPLDEHLATVLRSLAGLDHAAYGGERVEGVFLVNTDGRLFHVVDAYEDGRELGNVFSTPLETIAASPGLGRRTRPGRGANPRALCALRVPGRVQHAARRRFPPREPARRTVRDRAPRAARDRGVPRGGRFRRRRGAGAPQRRRSGPLRGLKGDFRWTRRDETH